MTCPAPLTPNSRSYITHFSQPDSIILDPYNPLDLNRYSYARSNPLKYNDPSGHWVETVLDIAFIAYDIYQIQQEGWTLVNAAALAADAACAIVPIGTGGGPALRALASGQDVATAVAAATKAAAQLPDVVRVGQATEKVAQFAASRKGIQGHHAWPKYLLGPEKQSLYGLSDKLHAQYHNELDSELSRQLGKSYYQELLNTPEKLYQLLEWLLQFNKDFDIVHNTHTYEALEDVLREEGLLPKPKGPTPR